jgi:N-acetyl-gamma-glutamyl-phosphate reductase
MHKVPIGILGASGYAGRELMTLVSRHPAMTLAFAAAGTRRGERADVDGRTVTFAATEEAPLSDAALVFSALPHGESAPWVAAGREAGAKVVDLSADLRPGASPGLPVAAPYGLTEIAREAVRGADVVANPGCYATAALLALWPLHDVLEGTVVVDAKSGMTGAGRGLKDTTHAGFVLENFSPYAVGAHRHAPEIEQALGASVCFVPHLLPVRRGLLATCYVQTSADARALVEAAYASSSVVRVLPEGVAPEIARVQGTDAAEIAVFTDRSTGTSIVICAIDNLGKGAAGQAVQNANLALGLPETAGLRIEGVRV